MDLFNTVAENYGVEEEGLGEEGETNETGV